MFGKQNLKLNERLNTFYINTNNNLSFEIKHLERELDEIHLLKAKIRSRIKWLQEGEKITKLFSYLETHKQ